MKKILKTIALFSLLTSTSYSSSIGICKGCHGQNFTNSVHGNSKILKEMNKKEIVRALQGYKKRTYGGVMKSVMESQVKTLNLSDMEELANLIKE